MYLAHFCWTYFSLLFHFFKSDFIVGVFIWITKLLLKALAFMMLMPPAHLEGTPMLVSMNSKTKSWVLFDKDKVSLVVISLIVFPTLLWVPLRNTNEFHHNRLNVFSPFLLNFFFNFFTSSNLTSLLEFSLESPNCFIFILRLNNFSFWILLHLALFFFYCSCCNIETHDKSNLSHVSPKFFSFLICPDCKILRSHNIHAWVLSITWLRAFTFNPLDMCAIFFFITGPFLQQIHPWSPL